MNELIAAMIERSVEDLDSQLYEGRFLPSVWPGMYPATYVTQGGCELCHECATEAKEDEIDPVADFYVRWEGPAGYCDGCGVAMPTAYGDPDEEEAL